MYIVESTGVGEYTPWRMRIGMRTLGPASLRFLSLDNFGIDQHTLTADHLGKIRGILGPTVDASWNTMQPIDLIRLVGHTDDSGSEKYNRGLGDRRAEAVAAELIKSYPQPGRVKIELIRSPGEQQPTAANRTSQGRARNRRVEVFIVSGGQPIPEPPQQPPQPPCPRPPCLTVTHVPEESVIKTRHDPMWDVLPSAPRGKSVRDWLLEICERGFPAKRCPFIVDQVLKGSCWTLEQMIGRAGASLNSKQKEELRQMCRGAATKRSIR
jgi:OmpA family protein